MMPGAGGDVNTTLPIILGVISCLCCGISFILGVVGIVLAVQAGNAKNMGDIEGARSKAKTATILGAVGIGLGLLLDVVWGIINVAANS
jgi:drug/metabolite transporter (DMT)-like permease